MLGINTRVPISIVMIEINRDILFQIFNDYVQNHSYFKLKQISKLIVKNVLKIDSKTLHYDKIMTSISKQLYQKFIRTNTIENIVPYNYNTYKVVRK